MHSSGDWRRMRVGIEQSLWRLQLRKAAQRCEIGDHVDAIRGRQLLVGHLADLRGVQAHPDPHDFLAPTRRRGTSR
jgi:hypothetical protein